MGVRRLSRVLVSGASGVVGYGILRSLRLGRPGDVLIGTSIHLGSVAPAFCDHFEQAMPTADLGYVDWLEDTLRRHRIDVLLPGIEADFYLWADHEVRLRATGAIPLLNTPDLLRLCRDKWLFYEALSAQGHTCAIPSLLEGDFEGLAARFGVPFLLKPRRGFGSKGIVRISTHAEFEPYRCAVGQSLLAQPIVGEDDEEYTVAVFGDGAGGQLARISMRRILSGSGFTERAEVVDDAPFERTLDALCRDFRPSGPTNFQFRLTADGPLLLEINPRISSSTSIRAAFGYNESAMAVSQLLDGVEPTQPVVQRGRAVRYFEDCIFYDNRTDF
jgi:carbamoyl-phosphate synthase large subunit